MRKEFSATIEGMAKTNTNLVFLTGDLGFLALENVKSVLQERFLNMGVSEQNMISVAAALASEGLMPICYSIAPFTVFRPAEQIRLDVCLHDKNVKIVGNCGGYGYGIMGATHHAIEDIAVLTSFQNMKCYIPFCNEDVQGATIAMLEKNGPSYLRLGFGIKPSELCIPEFADIRKICSGEDVTIVAMGPIVLNAIEAMNNSNIACDVFVFSKLPVMELSDELLQSILKTKKLIILEEHVSRGGLGEMLALILLKEEITCKVVHKHALGYPNELYGSQSYHQKICKLDALSISEVIEGLKNDK